MTAARVPYVSIVYAGRVDEQSGDFNARFARAFRFNHARLTAAGVRFDVLIVESPPSAGMPRLGDIARREVPDIDRVLTTFVIDGRYDEALSQDPRVRFQEAVATNVAIRRAAGSYILAARADIYLGPQVIGLLAQRLLQPMVLYRMTRVDLKPNVDPSAVDHVVLADSRNFARMATIERRSSDDDVNACLVLDRFSWHQLRGFNEVHRGARLPMAASFAHHAQMSGVLVKDNAARVFRLRNRIMTDDPRAGAEDTQWRTPVVYDNPLLWGLEGAPVSCRSDNDARIEFDERVVPPLVSLRGITTSRR